MEKWVKMGGKVEQERNWQLEGISTLELKSQ